MDITLDTDWGAKGKQLTGAQVQSFIKQQFRDQEIINMHLGQTDTVLKNSIDEINKKLSNQKSQTNAITDGCMIAYHRKSDNWPIAVPYWEWPALETAGEVADGVLVLIDGQEPIVVAPTQEQRHWSKFAIDVNLSTGLYHEKAFADFSGQTRTAALIAKREDLFGPGENVMTDYAAGWCYEYDRSFTFFNEDLDKTTVVGVKKNLWWLPSIAELITIWKHKYAINLCLSVIKNATPLDNGWFWSSTEATASTVWRLNMGTGAIQGSNNKTTFLHSVRPITAFYDPAIFNGDSDLDNEVILADERFTRYGNCAVFMENNESKPIVIRYPLTEEKIQLAIMNYQYTDQQVFLITNNYQLALYDDTLDQDLKVQYVNQFNQMQNWQKNSLTTSRQAIKRRRTES